jgi:prepilin-type N-terminal cleavage/methylation domain-containing protein
MSSSARSGFTLVEVLVVIAITSLLAGLILTYSSESRDQVALYVHQAKLSQTISKAKSLTVSTYNNPVIPCGYGVHVDYAQNTYKLFSYGVAGAPPQCSGITTLDNSLETTITTEKLPPNLSFEKPDSEAIVDILFLPPNPDTWIWLHGGNGTSTFGSISLQTNSGTWSVPVLVSSAGQISF